MPEFVVRALLGAGKWITCPSSKLSFVACRLATGLFKPARRGPELRLAREDAIDESESLRALFMSKTSPEEGATFSKRSGALEFVVEEATSEVAFFPHWEPAGESNGGELSVAIEALRSS